MINSFITLSFVNWPKTPDTELIKINRDEVVAIFLGKSALSKNKMGLKNIPPPIPTTPEIKPRKEPRMIEKYKLIFFIIIFSSLNALLWNNNKKPAIDKIRNNKISKTSWFILRVPPKKASGIEPIKNGNNNLKLWFPALI